MIKDPESRNRTGLLLDGADSPFFRRKILIATSHGKEAAIGPVLQRRFEATIIVPDGFNTDAFGTFSGEIPRTGSPLDAARRKSAAAASAFNARLVIASEGSFGPHPSLFFVPGDDEVLLLTDYENDLELAVRHISTSTNFRGKIVRNVQELQEFAIQSGFPKHKLILRRAREDSSHIVKDVVCWADLEAESKTFLERFGSVFIETDMRAMNNPTRMNVIEQAARKLADLMATGCPACRAPGFDVGEVIPGLPCQLCSAPTRSTLQKRYVCKKCHYSEDLMYPNNKNVEDPMYCDWCNP